MLLPDALLHVYLMFSPHAVTLCCHFMFLLNTVTSCCYFMLLLYVVASFVLL